MKPACFRKTGAAFVAALVLAGMAGAQSSGEGALTGGLDLSPPLEGSDLFSGLVPPKAGSAGPASASVIVQQGSGNAASITQTGHGQGALALISQSGTDNAVELSQCNCGNLAGILQDGTGNLSQVSQTGTGNILLHRQYGDGLSLSVAQYGGAQISITQTGP